VCAQPPLHVVTARRAARARRAAEAARLEAADLAAESAAVPSPDAAPLPVADAELSQPPPPRRRAARRAAVASAVAPPASGWAPKANRGATTASTEERDVEAVAGEGAGSPGESIEAAGRSGRAAFGDEDGSPAAATEAVTGGEEPPEESPLFGLAKDNARRTIVASSAPSPPQASPDA